MTSATLQHFQLEHIQPLTFYPENTVGYDTFGSRRIQNFLVDFCFVLQLAHMYSSVSSSCSTSMKLDKQSAATPSTNHYDIGNHTGEKVRKNHGILVSLCSINLWWLVVSSPVDSSQKLLPIHQ